MWNPRTKFLHPLRTEVIASMFKNLGHYFRQSNKLHNAI